MFADWTDEQYLRHFGGAPFRQSPPSKSCDNPECTAEIVDHIDEIEVDLASEPPSGLMAEQARLMGIDLASAAAEYFGTTKLKFDAHDVRADSMRVIAIHQPDRDDRLIWGDDLYHQIVFEVCDSCHCIRASQQCT
jgi:hypothetical protein